MQQLNAQKHCLKLTLRMKAVTVLFLHFSASQGSAQNWPLVGLSKSIICGNLF